MPAGNGGAVNSFGSYRSWCMVFTKPKSHRSKAYTSPWHWTTARNFTLEVTRHYGDLTSSKHHLALLEINEVPKKHTLFRTANTLTHTPQKPVLGPAFKVIFSS